MTAADKIAEARALIEPLTGHTPGPWFLANGNEVHDRGTRFGSQGERLGETPMLLAETYYPRADENARLCAAAPALRDTVAALADLAEALAQENAKLREALKRIDSASKFFSQPGHSDDTLRYAHESTGHITAAALGDAQ